MSLMYTVMLVTRNNLAQLHHTPIYRVIHEIVDFRCVMEMCLDHQRLIFPHAYIMCM